MATTITYKGSSLASFSNNTKTLKTAGKYLEGDITISASTVLGTTTVVPSETTQTISPASGQEGLSSVTVNGITNTYVGSSVPTGSLTVAGPTVTASAGYYASDVTETIPNGNIRQYGVSRQAGTTSITYSISWDTIEPGYIDTNPTAKVTLTKESYSITPTTSTQTITPSGSMNYIANVTVQPIPSEYVVPTGVTTITTNGTYSISGYASADIQVPDNALVVNVTRTDNYTPDKTFSEMQSAYNAGKEVVVKSTPMFETSAEGKFNSLGDTFTYTVRELHYLGNDKYSISNRYYYYTETGLTYSQSTSYYQCSGTLPITSNTTSINVRGYEYASVNVQPTLQAKNFTPSETSTTITFDSGYDGLSSVTVAGITNTYVGSSIPSVNSSSITVNYETDNNIIRIGVSKGYLANIATNSKAPESILPAQSATTIIPSESSQTAVDIHKWTTGTVTVAAITPTYVGTGVTTNPTITVSGPSVTIPAGYYSSQQTKTIANGTEGTPTASKTVDTNEAHAIITPSVTNVSGYITGGTKTGPTILVTARELVSGNTIICDDAGDWDVAECETIEVPEARYFTGMNWGYTTQNNQRKFQFLPRTIVDPEEGGQAGWIAEGVYDGLTSTFSAVPSGITITPTQTTQTIGGTNYMMEGPVTVAAVTTGYLKGMLTMPTDIDFSTGHTPTATWTVEPSGMVIYQCYGSGSITNAVYSSGYIENTQQIPAEYEAGGSYQLPTQGATTVIPSETAQTLSVNQKYMTGNVTVAAITSTYVGSGITRNPTVTVSGPSVTIPAGYYSSQQTKTVASGSVDIGIEATVEALPTITVSASGLITALNNSTGQVEIEVNPGYISGNTTGTIGIAGESTRQLSTQGATTVTPSTSTQTINVTGKYMTGNVTVNPIPSQYIVPSGTYTISSVDSTNTFNVTNYASAKVTITDADSIAY